MQLRREIKKKWGFTLLELVVVVAIISILTSIAMVNLNGARARARDLKRIKDVEAIGQAILLYTLDHNGVPPDTSTGYYGWCCVGFPESGPNNSNNCYASVQAPPPYFNVSYKGCNSLNSALAPYLPNPPRDPDKALPMTGYLYSSDPQGLGILGQAGFYFYLETEAMAQRFDTAIKGMACDGNFFPYDGGYDCSYTIGIPITSWKP